MGDAVSDQAYPAEWDVAEETMDVRDFHRAVELRNEKAELEAKLKKVKDELAVVEERIIETMIQTGFEGGRFSGTTIYTYNDVRASAKAGQMERLCGIMRELGFGDIVKERINGNTLTSTIKSIMETDGDELPEELREVLNIMVKPKVGYRKQ